MVIGVDDALIAAGITAAISAAASTAGSYMNNQTAQSNAAAGNFASFQIADANRRDAQAQYDQNWFRALAMDDRNKAYATDMSNTAYQRAMQDMRSAGLNPMLAYQQGGANSAPVVGQAPSATTSSSSSYQHNMPRTENIMAGMTSNAVQAAHVIQNLRQGTANIDQTRQLTQQAESQTALNRAEEQRSQTASALALAQTTNEEQRNPLIREQIRTQEALTSQRRAETDYTTQRAYTEREHTGTARETRLQAYNETRRQQDYGTRPTTVGDNLGAAEAIGRRTLGDDTPFGRILQRIR